MHSHHTDLSAFDPLDVLQLIRSENVGPVTCFHLLSFYGTPQKALEAIPQLAKKGGKKRALKLCPRSEAEHEMQQLNGLGVNMLLYGKAPYPPLMQHAHDAPPLLMARGHTQLLSKPMIGIVGARNASANGCHFIQKTANQLGEAGYVVVSGMARGIDTAAHTGALETGTVAVIAGGIDHIYPPENEKLYHALCDSGVVISEAPFGTAPMARHFPARNRIIAGMSAGLVVCEASAKSGSLITAHYALDYGREVFAVPGSPLDPRSAGANGLIQQGATLIESAEDVLNQLSPEQALQQLDEPEQTGFSTPPTAAMDEQTLAQARQLIEEKLGPEPVYLDELLAQCQITAQICQQCLLELELAGRLVRHPGNRVSLRYEVK